MIMEMVRHCVYCLNASPHPLGISTTLSPRTRVTGEQSITTAAVNLSLVSMYKHTNNMTIQ